jgi:hypothetical protein
LLLPGHIAQGKQHFSAFVARNETDLIMLGQRRRTTNTKQRISAAGVLFALILPLIICLRALSSEPEALLPACCRSNGKHHCMMSAEQMTALLQGKYFTEVHSKCPLVPHSVPASGEHASLKHVGLRLSANHVSNPVMQPTPQTVCRHILDDKRHKRGPPSSTLS